MKKVLVVHFGGWLSERDAGRYLDEIYKLTELLEKKNILVERLERMPVDYEIAACDAIVFLCIGLKKEAKKIKAGTDKLVFMLTGLPERGDDEFGVIPLDKSPGYHVNVMIISEKLK